MTKAEIREAIDTRLDEIVLGASPTTHREDIIDKLDKACDDAWGDLVRDGCLDQYDVDDLTETVESVAQILRYAKKHAWVEDDSGLWEGLTYGLPACIAYYSLRNCFYQAMADRGHDTNDDFPFSEKG